MHLPIASDPARKPPLALYIIAAVLAFHVLALAIAGGCGGCGCRRGHGAAPEEPPSGTEEEAPAAEPEPPQLVPVRPFPARFPKGSHMPDIKEAEASGAISNSVFSPGRDLVYVEDPHVWWESDFDGETDDEDDHSMHRCIEPAFRRLVAMLAASNATLRVQEAYRPSTIHASTSLHKEGRALDLTCPDLDPSCERTDPSVGTQIRPTPLSLEILAKMCWAAGFDWVYYEVPKNSGPHLHVSSSR